MRTITIIHPGTLGDVLLSLPAVKALRASFPGRKFGLLAGSEVGKLLQACGEIEQFFPLESDALASLLGDHAMSSSQASASQALHEWLNRCDLAVCWMADRDGRLARRLGDLGVDRVIVGSPLSPDYRAAHQADRFIEIIREAVTANGYEGKLNIHDKVLEAAKGRLEAVGVLGKQPLAIVHPGSGSPHKCSEPTLLAGAVEWLRAHGAVPVLVGGPADDEKLAEVSGRCADCPPVFQGLDVLSMAGLLAQAQLFLGHDSGLTHLAAALHLPTVALFGPTDSNRWAPRGLHVSVLSGASCLCRERGWQAVQQCPDKPCLRVPVESLVLACKQGLQRQEGMVRNLLAVDRAPCHA